MITDVSAACSLNPHPASGPFHAEPVRRDAGRAYFGSVSPA
jgi:hypothetical protein